MNKKHKLTPKEALDSLVSGTSMSEVVTSLTRVDEFHQGGGKGLLKRLYLTKKQKDDGEGKGDIYWHKRNKLGKSVAKAVATELVPGGTLINAGRLAKHIASRFKEKKKGQKPASVHASVHNMHPRPAA